MFIFCTSSKPWLKLWTLVTMEQYNYGDAQRNSAPLNELNWSVWVNDQCVFFRYLSFALNKIMESPHLLYESNVTLILLGVLTILFLPYLWTTRQRKQYPPGPFSFPILGNIPQIVWYGSMEVFLQKYRKQFGNVSHSQCILFPLNYPPLSV